MFAETWRVRANIVPLAQILVISGPEQVQTACLYLAQSHAAPVLQLLTQPLGFASWFNANVGQQWRHDWLKLSLIDLREVAQSTFRFPFPHIHVVLHFWLLFLSNEGDAHAVEVRMLFDSVMAALLPHFRHPTKARVFFASAEA
jgi:hypothetical protein